MSCLIRLLLIKSENMGDHEIVSENLKISDARINRSGENPPCGDIPKGYYARRGGEV